MNGVLEYAGAVAQRKEMPDTNVRYDVRVSTRDDRVSGKQYSRLGISALGFEGGKIAFGRLHPSHRSACGVGALAHGVSTNIVRQQTRDLDAQSFGIPKRN